MFKQALITVVAFTGLAFSAPAQLHIRGELGRHIQVSATLGGSRYHPPQVRYPRRVVRHGRSHGHHGYWKTVQERVWVPGGYREEYCPPRYGWIHDSCGRRVWGIIDAGGMRRVFVPGHFETCTRRVYVDC